jgi:glutathione S-transferase
VARLCPFAHRSRLTLAEKQIPFTLIEIDLQNKPANFAEVSPTGKVPILKHGHYRIWESAIINECLEDAFPDPPLLPKDPTQRAQARLRMQFADARLFASTHKLFFAQNPQSQAEIVQEITESLRSLEQDLQTLAAEGPYWLGADLSLVDLTYWPWFEQVTVLEHFCGFTFPCELDRLNRWWEGVAEREAVRLQSQSPEFYLEHYAQLQQQIFKA